MMPKTISIILLCTILFGDALMNPVIAQALQFGFISTKEINYLTAQGPVLADGNSYGIAVANIGDLNNDGVNDIAVGAPNDNTGGISRGAVYIHFMNTKGNIDSTKKIDGASTHGATLADIDMYGMSVAGIGDLNQDGMEDIAVGAYQDDMGGNNRGTVYIHFLKSDGSIKSTLEINSSIEHGPALVNSDYYGRSIANIGDMNGDGIQDLAVGAIGDDTNGSGCGAVYIHFMNTDGTVQLTKKIDATATHGPMLIANDKYGTSIAGIGDLNNDGVQDFAVGAVGDDAGGTDKGIIYIHFMNEDGSIQLTKEINDITENGPYLSTVEMYGASITNMGDLNSDGISEIAVGAHYNDAGVTNGGEGFMLFRGVVRRPMNRGAVNIHYLNTDGSISSTMQIDDFTNNGPYLSDDDSYGYSIANIGDLNGDGWNDIAVGAPQDDAGGPNRGAVHVSFTAYSNK